MDSSGRVTKPSVAGHTLDCLEGLGQSSGLVAVYNPNVEAIDGLFFLL